MKNVITVVMIGLVSLFLLSGCGTSKGFLGHSVQTSVELTQNNFRVVQHLQTSASTDYLFLAIPLTNQNSVAQALDELYRKADLEGKPRALANVSTTVTWKNVFIPYIPIWGTKEIIISADVIEFTK